VNAKVATGNKTVWEGELCKEMPQILSQLTMTPFFRTQSNFGLFEQRALKLSSLVIGEHSSLFMYSKFCLENLF